MATPNRTTLVSSTWFNGLAIGLATATAIYGEWSHVWYQVLCYAIYAILLGGLPLEHFVNWLTQKEQGNETR